MRAKLKNIYSLEIKCPLAEYWPEDTAYFGISIRLIIGLDTPAGGEESFDLFVCTPDWLKNQCAEIGYVWGRSMLIVHEYDFNLIKREVERYVASCAGDDWLTIARKLSYMGTWEFEDYQPGL
jgi:hypothetical protein